MTLISGKQPLWPYLGDPPCNSLKQVVVFPVAKVVKERVFFTSWFQLLLSKPLNHAATFEAGSAIPVRHFAVCVGEHDTIKYTCTNFKIAVVCFWP